MYKTHGTEQQWTLPAWLFTLKTLFILISIWLFYVQTLHLQINVSQVGVMPEDNNTSIPSDAVRRFYSTCHGNVVIEIDSPLHVWTLTAVQYVKKAAVVQPNAFQLRKIVAQILRCTLAVFFFLTSSVEFGSLSHQQCNDLWDDLKRNGCITEAPPCTERRRTTSCDTRRHYRSATSSYVSPLSIPIAD